MKDRQREFLALDRWLLRLSEEHPVRFNLFALVFVCILVEFAVSLETDGLAWNALLLTVSGACVVLVVVKARSTGARVA